MNQLRKLLSRTRTANQPTLQKIRDEAVAKYEDQFYLLLTELEYLNEIELDEEVLTYVNTRVPLLLKEIDDLFENCKTACIQAAPRSLHEDLEELSKSNKYAYAQTCKSLKTIEACVQFNTLFSMFESRLHALNRKLGKHTPSRRSSAKTRTKTKPTSTAKSRQPRQIARHTIRKFHKYYNQFLGLD